MGMFDYIELNLEGVKIPDGDYQTKALWQDLYTYVIDKNGITLKETKYVTKGTEHYNRIIEGIKTLNDDDFWTHISGDHSILTFAEGRPTSLMISGELDPDVLSEDKFIRDEDDEDKDWDEWHYIGDLTPDPNHIKTFKVCKLNPCPHGNYYDLNQFVKIWEDKKSDNVKIVVDGDLTQHEKYKRVIGTVYNMFVVGNELFVEVNVFPKSFTLVTNSVDMAMLYPIVGGNIDDNRKINVEDIIKFVWVRY